MSSSLRSSRLCWICGKAVDLETSKADEHGNAVHGRCYAAKMALVEGTRSPDEERSLPNVERDTR
jgi:hypothetical protein